MPLLAEEKRKKKGKEERADETGGPEKPAGALCAPLRPSRGVKHKPQIDHSPAHPEETPQEVQPDAR